MTVVIMIYCDNEVHISTVCKNVEKSPIFYTSGLNKCPHITIIKAGK